MLALRIGPRRKACSNFGEYYNPVRNMGNFDAIGRFLSSKNVPCRKFMFRSVRKPCERSFCEKGGRLVRRRGRSFSVGPRSACSVFSPSLLTCLNHFVHVRYWPNLENAAVLQGRMLRHELYSMIHVPRLKDENAAELFLGFRIGTVRSCDFPVLPIQGRGGFRRLKRFSTSPMPVGAKMVVVFKAGVEHRVLLVLGHAFVFAFVEISQTDVFHCSSPPCGNQQHSLARWIVHIIVVAHRKNRQQSGFGLTHPLYILYGYVLPYLTFNSCL